MKKIEVDGSGRLNVPDTVEIPFIEGDGVGAEITPVMQSVVDAAVGKAYGGRRQIEWKEVLAGEKAHKITGSWLPEETMQAFRDYRVGIKGPLTTPVGGGIRSLNVAPAAGAGLVRLPAPGALVPGSGLSGQGAAESRYAYFPREYRGYLCGHRMDGRVRPRRRNS